VQVRWRYCPSASKLGTFLEALRCCTVLLEISLNAESRTQLSLPYSSIVFLRWTPAPSPALPPTLSRPVCNFSSTPVRIQLLAPSSQLLVIVIDLHPSSGTFAQRYSLRDDILRRYPTTISSTRRYPPMRPTLFSVCTAAMIDTVLQSIQCTSGTKGYYNGCEGRSGCTQ